MKCFAAGHGCLLIIVCGTGLVAAGNSDPIRTPSRLFDIQYEVNEDSLPLERVELFYTLDQGENWRSFGCDEDRQSPLSFHAPQEGLFGFFLVVSNTSGSSGPVPSKGTTPSAWAFVDGTPPIVQLHECRQTTSLGLPVIQVRWTAIDTHLLPRPIEISYQCSTDTAWHPVTPEPLANTGRFDWRIPSGISGPLKLRVMAADEGGHRSETPSQSVEIPGLEMPDRNPLPIPRPAERKAEQTHGSPPPAAIGQRGSEQRLDPPQTLSPNPQQIKSKQRADQLYQEALALRGTGLDREAIARLREAVQLDPQRSDALSEMGQAFYRLGDLDRSLDAFEISLKIQPDNRSALRGSARVHEQRREFPAAADRLRTILKYNASDAEVWMQLGDLAVFQGDELLARDCYTRASRSDPNATQVIADARKRLNLMAEGSAAASRR